MVRKCLALLLALVMALPAFASNSPPVDVSLLGKFKSYSAFGDSITAGCCPSSYPKVWLNILGAQLGLTPVNHGVSGSEIADQQIPIYQEQVSSVAAALYTLMIGTNDATFAGTGRQLVFQAMHQAALAWLAMPAASKTIGQSASQSIAISSITSNGSGIATATTTAPHGLSSGTGIAISGATQSNYNVTAPITVTGASTFTYPIAGTPTTPATTGSAFAAATPGITYTGSWAPSSRYGGAMSQGSNTNGSTATFKAYGPVIYLAYGLSVGDGGTFDVTVDGAPFGSFTTAFNQFGSPGAFNATGVIGGTYGSALARLAGLSTQYHTVTVTVSSATNSANNVWIDWVGSPSGATAANGPLVIAGGIPQAGNGSTTSQGFTPFVMSDVGMLAGDGLSIVYADVPGFMNPGTDINPDNTHPNDAGEVHIEQAYLGAINTAIVSTGKSQSAILYARNNGLGIGAAFGNYIANSGTGNYIAAGGFISPNLMFGSGNNNAIVAGLGNHIGQGGTTNTNGNFIGAGNQNVAQFGGFNAIAAGSLTVAQGFYNFDGAGVGNRLNGTASGILSGECAFDRARFAWEGFGSGCFNAVGDAQFGQQVLMTAVSGTATGRATSGGTSAGIGNCINMPAQSAYAGRITAVGFDTATFDAAMWIVDDLLAVRGSGNVAIVGTPTVTKKQNTSGASGWSLAAPTADTTNQCINLSVTGTAGASIHFVAYEAGPEVQ